MIPRALSRPFAFAGTLISAAWLAGCAGLGGQAGSVPGQLSNAAVSPAEIRAATAPRASNAANPRDYRRDAARHVYDANKERIYGGKLPPLLYAVGTLQVDLDANGRVLKMHWMRAPQHAPEVIKEIERTVLQAAPYPAATRLGKVTWTDTWLWDKGGRFQLDTLSEGQL